MITVKHKADKLSEETLLSQKQCKDILFSIIKWCYDINEQLDYAHGDVQLSYIKYEEIAKDIKFDQNIYKGDITLYIENSKNTSIRTGDYNDKVVRICNKKDIKYSNVEMESLLIETEICDRGNCSELITLEGYNTMLFYIFDDNVMNMYKNSGEMLFTSMDLYLFLSKLLTNNSFREYILSNSFARNLYKDLFIEGDYDILLNRSINNNEKILEGLRLRCDGLEFAMNRLNNEIKTSMSKMEDMYRKKVSSNNSISSPKRR